MIATPGRAAIALLVLGAWAPLGGCATPDRDPRYRPTESVLEVVALLARHVDDDTYRFEPARDFTGRNVYRASLQRLENLETVHEEALRAGHMDDVVLFSKGRALERLRAFGLAASSYERVAEHGGSLAEEARHAAFVCRRLSQPPRAALAPDPETAHLARREDLESFLPVVAGTHYAAVVREEIEHADVGHARARVARRGVDPEGNVAAMAALQRLVIEHRESHRANRHLLELADFYATLAEEYVDAHPPESLGFDPPAFEDLVASAARLYEAVANQDGAVERVEAAQRLEAFVAFTLRVDRDRFTP